MHKRVREPMLPKTQQIAITDVVDLWTICSRNGIILEDHQLTLLERYHNDLVYWNKRVNLVSRKDIHHLYARHILHSLAILKYVTIPPKAWVIDIGTGGGLPGLPLKIARPDIRILLIDAMAKKTKLVKMFAQHTELRDITVRTLRAEALADYPEYHHFFHLALSRGVAPLVQLLSWTHSIMRSGGQVVALKGGDLRQEIAEARKKFPELEITEQLIQLAGYPWYEENHKKIIICRYPMQQYAH